jgi:hypothetical protein
MSVRLSSRALLAVLLVAAPLAACGKAGQPGLPVGEKSTYPHPYPTGATQNATPSVPGSQPVPEDTTSPLPAIPPNVLPTNPPTIDDPANQ